MAQLTKRGDDCRFHYLPDRWFMVSVSTSIHLAMTDDDDVVRGAKEEVNTDRTEFCD